MKLKMKIIIITGIFFCVITAAHRSPRTATAVFPPDTEALMQYSEKRLNIQSLRLAKIITYLIQMALGAEYSDLAIKVAFSC
jgi:hypothetical protein